MIGLSRRVNQDLYLPYLPVVLNLLTLQRSAALLLITA